MNQIIKFFKRRPLISLILLFGIWINSLPLPDTNIGSVRPYSSIERTSYHQKSLAISGGDGFINQNSADIGFTTESVPDRGQDRFQDYDPGPKIGSEGSSSRDRVSLKAVKDNKIPDESDWNANVEDWDDQDQCNDFEESSQSKELPVSVNFEYEKDSNGNPTLLVPNLDTTRTMKGRTFNKIEYAKSHVPPEIIIKYQNAMGLAMQPSFGTGADTHGLRGFAGKRKADVGLVVQSIPRTENYYLSIINDRNIHVSSYPITEGQLKNMIKNDFWVLPTRDFN